MFYWTIMWKSAQIVNVRLHSLLQHPDQDIEHCNSEAPSHPMPWLSLPFSPKVTVIQNYKVTISFSCFIMLSYDIYSCGWLLFNIHCSWNSCILLYRSLILIVMQYFVAWIYHNYFSCSLFMDILIIIRFMLL